MSDDELFDLYLTENETIITSLRAIYNKGYERGGKHMEEVKQFVIDELLDQIKTLEADGCESCAFMDKEEWEMPCCKCKRNCKDYWRAKEQNK